MTAPLPPTNPASVFGAQASKGELILTQDNQILMWDGSQWVTADLQPIIFGTDPRMNQLEVDRLSTWGLELPVRYGPDLLTDPAQVVPGELLAEQFMQFDLSPGRQPGVMLTPPVFVESDLSILSAALQLLGSSPDLSGTPQIYLWTKQAGAVRVGVVTDASSLLNNVIEVDQTGINLVAGIAHQSIAKVSDGSIQLSADEVDLFGTNIFLVGDTYIGNDTHRIELNGRMSVYGTAHQMWRFSNVGAVAFITVSFNSTMSSTPAVVGAIDAASAPVMSSFSFVSTTSCRVYCSNWTAVTTEWINLIAEAFIS